MKRVENVLGVLFVLLVCFVVGDDVIDDGDVLICFILRVFMHFEKLSTRAMFYGLVNIYLDMLVLRIAQEQGGVVGVRGFSFSANVNILPKSGVKAKATIRAAYF